jgi:hypothetical protein
MVVSMHECLRRVCAGFRSTCPVPMRWSVDERVPAGVMLDGLRLGQLLAGALRQACRSVSPAGIVDVTCWPHEGRLCVTVAFHVDDDAWASLQQAFRPPPWEGAQPAAPSHGSPCWGRCGGCVHRRRLRPAASSTAAPPHVQVLQSASAAPPPQPVLRRSASSTPLPTAWAAMPPVAPDLHPGPTDLALPPPAVAAHPHSAAGAPPPLMLRRSGTVTPARSREVGLVTPLSTQALLPLLRQRSGGGSTPAPPTPLLPPSDPPVPAHAAAGASSPVQPASIVPIRQRQPSDAAAARVRSVGAITCNLLASAMGGEYGATALADTQHLTPPSLRPTPGHVTRRVVHPVAGRCDVQRHHAGHAAPGRSRQCRRCRHGS